MSKVLAITNRYWKKVPFTLAAVKDAELTNKGEIIISHVDDPKNMYGTRIIDTDICNKLYPIAVAASLNGVEEVCCISNDGTVNKEGFYAELYVRTNFKTYEGFVPSLYQACLVRKAKDAHWRYDICMSIVNNTPTFYECDTVAQCLPISETTKGLLNRTISWQKYLEELL